MNIGRFELRRILGEGAQAIVWLGFDQRLEREVAVKVMRAEASADPVAVGEWLREARSVSRLSHPNIVPVFEADVLGQPYLVFEYVAGPTLSQHLKANGPMPTHQAVPMMMEVLDALQTAHTAGIVHRDLKPSNILVDTSGRARVMDFGIAARLNDPGDQDQIVGTPGYMSPEAAEGGLPIAAMDVFSAGLMLAEMLSGTKLIAERDPSRAMYRAINEDLALPAMPSDVDDALAAILRLAIARDKAGRWQTAAEMHSALGAWLIPSRPAQGDGSFSGPSGGSGSAANGSGTLEFLFRRMRQKSDFPALSSAVARIQRAAASENESLASFSSEILKDVALTHKLLRLVNTAHYSQSGGQINTVSRAVALIGFAGVRNLAISLVLLEHMQDKAHANQLKEEFLRALSAGMLASELGAQLQVGEEAFLGAMFQPLGRLLTNYYFPEEAKAIRGMVAAKPAPGARPMSEDAAATDVLGLSFEALGIGVAKSWGLPASLQNCMRKPGGEPPTSASRDAGERLRWLSFAANEVTDVLLQSEPAQAGAKVSAAAARYARALGVSAARIEQAATDVRQKLAQMAEAMNVHVSPSSPVRRLFPKPVASLDDPRAGAGAAPTAGGSGYDKTFVDHELLTQHTLAATATVQDPTMRLPLDNAAEVLAAGIQDITNSMVAESFKLNDVLRMILETMYRALGFRRVVFCLRDPKTETLTGRFGLGEGAESVAGHFKVPLKGATPDLFALVCLKGADTLFADTTVDKIRVRLPAWYRQSVNAPAFLLLPMLMKGAPFAFIYADKALPGGIELGEKELSLLRTLRNQAVMAFKQAS